MYVYPAGAPPPEYLEAASRAEAGSWQQRHASLHSHAPLWTTAVTLTHRSRRPSSNRPLYLPLPTSILVEYAVGMTRQEHASLTCAPGQRCMSLICAAACSSGIRRETRLVKRRACLLPRTVILHALSGRGIHTRTASHRSHTHIRVPGISDSPAGHAVQRLTTAYSV